MRTSEARAEFEREVEAARREFAQEVEAVRRKLGEKLEAVRRQALDRMGQAAFIKKAGMRKADALLHELEQHLLKQKAQR
jgi:F0F1-type ATP synthase membrane subunit b/b'